MKRKHVAGVPPTTLLPPNGDVQPVAGVPPPTVAPTVAPGLLRRGWRLIKIVFAFTIIIFAALLGLVPGIPGWPLGIFGLSILAAEFVWANRLLKRIKTGTAKLRDAALLRRKKNSTPGPKA